MLLNKENTDADDDLAAWAATSRAHLVQAGIDNPSTIAFDRYREKYEEFTAQMGDQNEGEAVTAKVYIAAARRLGDLLRAHEREKELVDAVERLEPRVDQLVAREEAAVVDPRAGGCGRLGPE